MSASEIPALDPDETYELCPACGGVRGRFDWVRRLWDRLQGHQPGGCTICWDQELVPHRCLAGGLRDAR